MALWFQLHIDATAQVHQLQLPTHLYHRLRVELMLAQCGYTNHVLNEHWQQDDRRHQSHVQLIEVVRVIRCPKYPHQSMAQYHRVQLLAYHLEVECPATFFLNPATMYEPLTLADQVHLAFDAAHQYPSEYVYVRYNVSRLLMYCHQCRNDCEPDGASPQLTYLQQNTVNQQA